MLLQRKINTPKLLYELHGKQTTILDLVLPYLGGIVLAVFCFYLPEFKKLPLWGMIVFIFLCIDDGGGIIANLTCGTKNYYDERHSLQWWFISFHALQPVVFVFLFSNSLEILIVSAQILVYTYLLNVIRDKLYQKTIAGFLFLVTLISIICLLYDNQLLLIIFIVLAVKLELAWAIKIQQND